MNYSIKVLKIFLETVYLVKTNLLPEAKKVYFLKLKKKEKNRLFLKIFITL